LLTQRQLTVLIFIGAVTWLTSLFLQGVSVDLSWLKSLSGVGTVVSFVLWVFDSWIWRLRLLHPWFVAQPNIRGTWKSEIHSTWINPETDQPLPGIEAYVVVRQSYSCITIRVFTRESESLTLAASLNITPDGLWQLASVYRNSPRATLLDRSVQHFGAIALDVRGDPAYLIDGQYWTNRNTRGEMRLFARSSVLYQDFNTASAAINEVRKP